MRKFQVIVVALLMSAAVLFMANQPPMQKDYDKLWRAADSLSKIRQPNAAMDVLDEIMQLANNESNVEQQLKARLYRLKLSQEFREDYLEEAISDFEDALANAGTPEKQILHSILGELYNNYFAANRYVLLERATLQDFTGADIKTWDASKVLEMAGYHYLQSLEEAKKNKELNIRSFALILEIPENDAQLRPTLFDFLAWRAIQFYSNNEIDISVATGRFIPKSEKYFQPAAGFSKMEIPAEYQNSNTAKVVGIMQEVLEFHLNDKNPAALIDADLKRLEFVYSKSVLANKDEIYLKALSTLHDTFIFSDASAAVAFQMAQFHNTRASQYNPLDESETMRWENNKAVEICRDAIKLFPESAGAANCKILIDNISRPELALQLEKTTLPGRPGLALLQWKNYSRINFRMIPVEFERFMEMSRGRSREATVSDLVALPYSLQWHELLPDTNDYQRHAAEIKIPPAEPGFYVLLASGSDNFISAEGQIAYAAFWSTELSYLSQRRTAGGYDIFILDSKTGDAVANANLKLFRRTYDNRKRTYETVEAGELQSDKNGFISLNPDQNLRGGITVEIMKGNDRYIPDENFFLSPAREREERTELKTFFFTDRAIYRPGQLLYFKGILLEKTGDAYEIKTGVKTKVDFFDVNNRLISSQELSVNEFGAVDGYFTIPTGLVNGMMHLKNESGSLWIRVEEYKRPRFEVTFDPLQDTYRLENEITVKGTARAYAGNNIDGATVKYRVVRNTYFPFPFPRFRGIWPQSQPVEIAAGETITGVDGSFSLKFNAIPDYAVSGRFMPSFTFTVSADVTDIDGETQSGTTAVNVSNQALLLDISAKGNINIQDVPEVKILATNLNGIAQAANVEVTISRLRQPETALIERSWQQPDIFIYDKETFEKEFPGREYRNETDPLTWEKVETILKETLITNVDSIIAPAVFENAAQGQYLVELKATDVFGNEVTSEKVITLFDPSSRRPPVKTFEWFEKLNTVCQPGETAQLLLGSSARGINVLTEVQFKGQTIRREWVRLKNNQQIIRIPVMEPHRGNLTFQYSYIFENRLFSGSAIIQVPYTNKMLDMAFETLRTDLEPGSKEKWTITLRDKHGDKVAAELLATLYDASLDAFVPHAWQLDLYNSYNNLNHWRASDNFKTIQAAIHSFQSSTPVYFQFPEYERLNWFGFSAFGSYFGRDMAISGKGSRTMDQPIAMNEMQAQDSEPGDTPAPPESGSPKIQKPDGGSAAPAAMGFQVRRDFKETAFFYPELRTNENGNVIIEFTLPESFTRWKFMALAHTTDLMTGIFEQEFTAAKKLMISANAPRFLRQGDFIDFRARITNLSDAGLINGEATLQFFDPVTMDEITHELISGSNIREFNVESTRGVAASWSIAVPENRSLITWRVKAMADNYSDGEEKTIPVLSNRMMVTEAMPMMLQGDETRQFTFQTLINSSSNTTSENVRLTLEFSSNPVWYAVQALPVISEVEEKNAVSVFNAFFANSIAWHIIKQNPQIERVFETWKSETPETFLSKLEKNRELRQVLIEQTPWLLEATTEQEQKQRIALLFDLNNMQNRLDATIRQLEQLQLQNGAFRWMNQMNESRYITRMIVQGIGKLDRLGVLDAIGDDRIRRMMNDAVRYLDLKIFEDYQRIRKNNPDKINDDFLAVGHIQYLYARSFFKYIKINPSHETGHNYFAMQAARYWQKQNNYLQGMIALALHRNNQPDIPDLIIKSLKDRALMHDDLGMYWRSESGYYWYQAPIESQAMMIEAFDEITSDSKSVDKMKIWLLTQKQTTIWPTSRATAEAVYALLERGERMLDNNTPVDISIAGKPIALDASATLEAGTGYFKKVWEKNEIRPQMGKVSVTKSGEGISWGAMFLQYFEDLDKIQKSDAGLAVQKQLFVEQDTEKGRSIVPLGDEETVIIGDRIMVRIQIQVDRDMEFVHLRDMRAPAFEPEAVISGYQYGAGLGYYQSIKDASADFFFDYLPKGSYVFEYSLRAAQSGTFSNGIATLQCMYAPEFVAHSKGEKVVVKE
jgi:hypothetical protein